MIAKIKVDLKYAGDLYPVNVFEGTIVTQANGLPLFKGRISKQVFLACMSMTTFSMSTTTIFATRLFGTVRKDLNRAITVRIRPLANVAPRYTPTSSLKWQIKRLG